MNLYFLQEIKILHKFSEAIDLAALSSKILKEDLTLFRGLHPKTHAKRIFTLFFWLIFIQR